MLTFFTYKDLDLQNNDKDITQSLRILVHEIQHANQRINNFARGNSPSAKYESLYKDFVKKERRTPTAGELDNLRNNALKNYLSEFGEIESRDVAAIL